MADELYNVIFRGDIGPGHDLMEVKARFAQLFKVDVVKVEQFFSGKAVVLKPNCDRVTADKFKSVLDQAGAVVEIRSAAPLAPVAVSTPVTPATSPVAPSSATHSPAPAAELADSWSLSTAGSNLLRPNEISQAAPVQLDISHISLVKRNPFATDAEEPLEAERHVTAPALDLSAYQVGDVGESLVEFKEFVPRAIDLSELSLDAAGADVLRPEERQKFVPVDVDTSSMDVAPAGGDLGQIKLPPAPPAPATDHISVQK